MNTTPSIKIVNPDSAGIDIGSSSHFVAVPPGRAHKMARALYFMMLRRTDFHEAGGDFYDKLNHEKTLKFLKKRAESLGYTLQRQES